MPRRRKHAEEEESSMSDDHEPSSNDEENGTETDEEQPSIEVGDDSRTPEKRTKRKRRGSGERRKILKKKGRKKQLQSTTIETGDFTTSKDFLNDFRNAVYFSRLLFDKMVGEEVEELPIEYAIDYLDDYLTIRNVILYMWWNDIAQWIACDSLLNVIPTLEYVRNNTNLTPLKMNEIIIASYLFLNRHGYINFGFMSESRHQEPVKTCLNNHHLDMLKKSNPDFFSNLSTVDTNKHIVVIGAGIAGILAAKQLLSFGYRVTIVEARSRAGGRMLTDYSWSDGAPVDIGASIVTCTSASPIVAIAKQAGINLEPIGQENYLLQSNGKKLSKEMDDEYQNLFNDILDKTCALKLDHNIKEREFYRRDPDEPLVDSHPIDLSKDSRKKKTDMSLGFALDKMMEEFVKQAPTEEQKSMREALHWHAANLDYGVGHDLGSASLYHWDQDDVFELGGDHLFVKEGFSSMIGKLCNDRQQLQQSIMYNQLVKEIDYSTKGRVVVRTVSTPTLDKTCTNPITGKFPKDGSRNDISAITSIECDAVLVTLPLGVLQGKANPVNRPVFNPPLPDWKVESIHKLGFGLLNKIILEFDYEFWDTSLFFFGLTHEEIDERGFCYLFWNLYPLTGKPLLCGLVAGKAAYALENDPDNIEYIKSKVMKHLKKSFVWTTNLPEPKKIIRTNWYHDPFSTGSYSYVRIGAKGEEYDYLAESINDRVFFGGEHTCRKFPATVLGSALSGLREAAKIDKCFTIKSNPSHAKLKEEKLASRLVSQQTKPKSATEQKTLADLVDAKFSQESATIEASDSKQRGWRRSVFAKPSPESSMPIPPPSLVPAVPSYSHTPSLPPQYYYPPPPPGLTPYPVGYYGNPTYVYPQQGFYPPQAMGFPMPPQPMNYVQQPQQRNTQHKSKTRASPHNK